MYHEGKRITRLVTILEGLLESGPLGDITLPNVEDTAHGLLPYDVDTLRTFLGASDCG